MIGMEKVPFERVLGGPVGTRLQALHEEHGIALQMERTVKAIEDDGDGNVAAVVLDNDVRIPADMCIVGAGVVPTTSFIKGVELQVSVVLLGHAVILTVWHSAIAVFCATKR